MSMNQWIGMLLSAGMLLSGTVRAEECQITLSRTKIDYNQIRRDDIVSTTQNWHKLSEWEVNVNVSCSEMHQMAVLVQGSAGEKGRFLFGARGGVGIKVENITVDGKSYSAGKTADQLNFTPESGTTSPLYVRNNEAVIAVENNVVPQGKQMSFRVMLFPVLNESMFSGNTDNTTMEADIAWRLLIK
ncbi:MULTISPECIES: DUF1120 domain-containing protein [Klebsiella]|uniref:hypothetical protein n=1 Tax=Klebsiella TaxID=570 RepID=UPI0012B80140|nr:hypothetical protein [Klebsiella michiganensis]MBZ7452957.1 hypothetical protein [Klebsiella michiganensis]MDS6632817.1 hypothetical protein [Klebsiella michiganensis]